jgi:hypothetical protein
MTARPTRSNDWLNNAALFSLIAGWVGAFRSYQMILCVTKQWLCDPTNSERCWFEVREPTVASCHDQKQANQTRLASFNTQLYCMISHDSYTDWGVKNKPVWQNWPSSSSWHYNPRKWTSLSKVGLVQYPVSTVSSITTEGVKMSISNTIRIIPLHTRITQDVTQLFHQLRIKNEHIWQRWPPSS